MSGIRMFLKRRWYLFVIVGVILIFVALRPGTKKKIEYTFSKPEVGSIAEQVEVSGRIQAARQATLRFLAGGKLIYLGVSEGQVVKKGARVASIDARDLQKNLKASLNTYSAARDALDQGRYDKKDVVYDDTTRRVLNKLQLGLDNNVIDVELKDLAIQNATLYAPLTGVVTSSLTQVAGMQVLATDTFEIVDPSSLQFVGEVDEADIGKIKEGQAVRITLDAYPDEKVQAIVRSIAIKSSISSKASGGTVFLVKADLASQDVTHYRLGMNGSMRITIREQSQALTIPLNTTTSRGGETYVKVQDPKNKAAVIEKKISTDIESDDRIQVTSGLSASDTIATTK